MGDSRLKKSGKNMFFAFAYYTLKVILLWVSRMIFVRYLNAGYLGINGLFTNIISVLSLADLGMGTAMMYSLYRPIAQGDAQSVASLVGFFRKIYLSIAAIILLAGIALIPALPHIVNLDRPIPFLTGYYLLTVCKTVISYLFVYRSILLTADQKDYMVSRVNMAFQIVTFAAQMATLILFRNYFLYLLAEVVVVFINNLFLNFTAMRTYPFLREKPEKLADTVRKRIWSDVRSLFFYRICGTIQSNTDNILTSVMVGTVYVGYYSNYHTVINALALLLSLVFGALKASVGNMLASGDQNAEAKQAIYWNLELINFWLVGFCSICMACLCQDFIRLSFPPEYVLPMPIVLAVLLNFYTSNIRQNIWTFRETSGVFHQTRHVTAVTAALNLFLSLLLGRFYGMFGIMIATVIARMLYAWWKEPIILFKEVFHASARQYLLTYLRRFGLCVAVGGVTYFLCALLPFEDRYVLFACKLAVCAAAPNLLFLLAFRKTAEFAYLRERILSPAARKLLRLFRGK